MPLGRLLLSQDSSLILVHRDHLRASFEAEVPEGQITLLMGDLARGILRLGRSPLIVAWNLEQSDRDLWSDISDEFLVPLHWLDTREPSVAALIPPLLAAEAA